jgi:hypothetical protein
LHKEKTDAFTAFEFYGVAALRLRHILRDRSELTLGANSTAGITGSVGASRRASARTAASRPPEGLLEPAIGISECAATL